MKRLKDAFFSMPIRSQLLGYYAGLFLVVLILGGFGLYATVRRTLEADIENELGNSTGAILNMVQTAVDTSIRNHLRSIAESNLAITRNYYEKYRRSEITEEEAKERVMETLSYQTIGKTGYIYCIDSAGIVQAHPSPELMGTSLSEHAFIGAQISRKEGYLEYDWANPGETKQRPKALYMTWFEPWDWIISISSYREEFLDLIHVDDFREGVLSLSFGSTGYSYVMDGKGTLIIHPKLQGTNIYGARDTDGRMFIREICERRTGKIVYPWVNPGETRPRSKLVIFNHIPELDWIVASSSYLEEFYKPLRIIKHTIFGAIVLLILLILPITFRISGSITRPLHALMNGFSTGAAGDYSFRMPIDRGDEIGRLAGYHNAFMEKLTDYSQKLSASEEKYRSIFENSLEGIFQTSPDGRFLSVNPAMASILGYASPEELVARVTDIGRQLYVAPENRVEIFRVLSREGSVTAFETRMYKKGGEIIWVSLTTRSVVDEGGNLLYTEGFLDDIGTRKAAEEAQQRIRSELERRVAERTAELSEWVGELTQRNGESALLREMSEMLQVCYSANETYPIISRFAEKFFPGYPGQILIRPPGKAALAPVVTWGEEDEEKEKPAFTVEECWALRKGRPYRVMADERHLACAHVSENTATDGYLCAPMTAQGELVGLFHIRFPGGVKEMPDDKLFRRLERDERLAATIAEHLALALTNLNLRETLRIQAIVDPLTGLYNRRHMTEVLERETARACRHGNPIGIIMLDVDHFKRFNDTHGHDAGDAILRELGAFLRIYSRREDIVVRYGGEEFTMILLDTEQKRVLAKAEKLCRRVREKLAIDHKGKRLSITISIGVAAYPLHGETMDQVLKAADKALYHAKAGGRNRVSPAAPLPENSEPTDKGSS